MMTDTTIKVLSIDPCQTPAGALNSEYTLRFMRRRGIARSAMEARNTQLAETLFGVSKTASGLRLALRLAVGLSLIVLGCVGLTGFAPFSALMSVAAVGTGLMVSAGLFTRLVGVAGVLGSVVALLAYPAASLLLPVGIGLGLSLLLVFSGPGRYSADRLLQRKLSDRLNNSGRGSRGLDDYRAFSRL